MDQTRSWEQETLINELSQGKELTEQLINNLDPLASKPELREFLIQKIISSYDKALAMLNWEDKCEGEINKSLVCVVGSPRSGATGDMDFKDQYAKNVCKKRKTAERWTEQVRICSDTGLGSLDDGYSWRKYGQKDILGANFPRAYYRCSHRHVQGCLATKQVQRSDGDSSIFEITYKGRHTCLQTSQLTPATLASIGKGSPKQQKDNPPHQPLFNCETTNIMKEFENAGTENFQQYDKENVFSGSGSPAFLSPEISKSDFFAPLENLGWSLQNLLPHSESDLSDQMISAPSSVTNSPIGNYFDFPLDQVDFDPNFPFDTCELFS